MRGYETAAVGAGLLDGHLAGGRTHWHKLFGDDLRIRHHRAVHRDGVALDDGVLQNFPVRAHGHRLHQRHSLAGFQILDHAAAHQHQRDYKVQRQQNMDQDPGHIHPKAAKTGGAHPAEAADQCKQHRDAGGGRNKVLHRQAQELAQVAQGGFAGVRLPVGVGHKAGCGVEGQIPLAPAQMLGVGRKNLLHHLQHPQKAKPDAGEDQHAGGVLFPVHFLVFINVEQPVHALLARAKHRGQEGFLSVHNPFDVPAQRHRQRDQNGQIQHILKYGTHTSSSPFIKIQTYQTSMAAAQAPMMATIACIQMSLLYSKANPGSTAGSAAMTATTSFRW